ncbi:MAG: hypothetical protein R3250_16200, partial [Melioribacteraceae bacterium]|nr:hypothetical protein [Melioribacteraceae bacterium]
KGEFKIEIKSNFNPKHSNITNTILHSRMIINHNIGDYQDMIPESWHMDKSDPVKLPASESLMLIEGEGPKQRIVLGPLYNDIVRDTEDKSAVTIYPKSVIYPTNFPKEQFTNKKYPLAQMFVNPCFLDTLYQSCAAHLLVTRKRVYLPWFAQDLGIVNVPKEEGVYTCYAQVIEDREDIVKYRVTMLDEADNVRYFVRNIEFRRINL